MYVRDYPDANPPPMYNHKDALIDPAPATAFYFSLTDMRYLLGDGLRSPTGTASQPTNGAIDPGEVPAATLPYLLWSAGTDGIYGFDSTTTNKTDDVANFEFPSTYRR